MLRANATVPVACFYSISNKIVAERRGALAERAVNLSLDELGGFAVPSAAAIRQPPYQKRIHFNLKCSGDEQRRLIWSHNPKPAQGTWT